MSKYHKRRKKNLIIFIIIVVGLIVWYLKGPVYKCTNVDKTSEWYVNDIYMSNQHYYKILLNEEEKELYRTLLGKLKHMETDIYLGHDTETILKVWDALRCDHPEMINITELKYTDYGTSIKLQPGYLTTSNFMLNLKERKVQREIGKIVKKLGTKNDYEKTKYIYEWLGKRSSYGKNISSDSDQSAYSAFATLSNTTCAGYGKAAQILLSNVGISSIININEEHLWNTVKLEGEYYFFDVTATSFTRETYEGNVAYMGLNQNKNTSNYEILYPQVLPNVSGEKYNYFDYEGLTLTYSDEIIDTIKARLNQTEFKRIEIKFTNPEEATEHIRENYMDYLGLRELEEYYNNADYTEKNGVIMFVKK